MRVEDLTTQLITHAIEIAFAEAVTGKVLVMTKANTVTVTHYTGRDTVKRRWLIVVKEG